jgi:precorrin-6A/cobalt-precorrin-6A reductase
MPMIEGVAPPEGARSVLLLGGTTEAFRLAQLFANEPGIDIITSLAGRTSSPRQPAGRLRVGGFGGADGLAEFLVSERIQAIIDATHPFAATITDHAVYAARRTGIPLLLLSRPPWEKTEQDQWIDVPDIETAVTSIPRRGRVLLAVGRQEAPAFAKRMDCWFLTRMMEPPDSLVPPGKVLVERPRDNADEECALMADNRINCVVAKNSGGPGYAKIEAASWMGLPVIMVGQPAKPDVERVSIVGDAAVWLRRLFRL